jgi:hypothetical protein
VLASDLVTLASLQKRIDFDEHDLSDMVSRLAVRYAAKEGGKLQELNMASQNRDASLYLGYAIVFSSCWIALFLCLPAGSEWKLRNSGAFWPVLAILLAFFLRSWIRMREFFLLLPGGLVTVLAFKARTDSDLSPTLAAAQPRLADIEARVSDLRLKALRQVAAPSLFGFVNWLIGSSRGAKEKRSTPSPFWLQRVYEEGQQFSESERKADYAAGWLESFGKYLFYRVAHAIVRLLLLLLGLLLYLAGINEWLQRVTARALEQQRLELGVTVRSTAALNADLEQTIAEFAAASQAAAQKLKNDSTS